MPGRRRRTVADPITKLLDEDLRRGALSVCNTVGYASAGISTYEMFESQKSAARYGRPMAMHSRFHTSSKPPNEAPLGFAEVFTNAVLLQAPLLCMHNNDYGWWEIEEKLQMDRKMGMNMWSEYYPYAAGSTAIGVDGYKPEAVEAKGRHAPATTKQRLKDFSFVDTGSVKPREQ